MNKKKYILAIIIGLIILAMIFLLIYHYYNRNDINDYSLVFDAKYYVCNNPDLKENIGDNENKLLSHFINYGMAEGRRASTNFDVDYYKENNPDLVASYGDDLSLYYKHYIVYGNNEGRKGSLEDIVKPQFECELHCKIKDNENLSLSLKFDSASFNEKYYIFEIPAYENNIDTATIVAEGRMYSADVTINKSKITNKYVVAKLNNNKYEMISNIAYIENPEFESVEINNTIIPNSKKGLQININNLEDAENLEPSYVFFNLFIEDILLMEYKDNQTLTYDYDGNTYFFNRLAVENYDKIISGLTNNGRIVVASILSKKKEGYDLLYYPEISMDTGTAFYAINTADKDGLRYFEAFVSFISNRYNGTSNEHGLIAKYTIGNEVNESGTYNYMGEKEINEYIDEYARTFRIAYNIIKSNNCSADVYVPMEPWWGIGSNKLTYGGREFLNVFNYKIKEQGNMNWGLAYHAYSYPLSDPKVANDNIPTTDENNEILEGYVTKDSFYAITITMENLDVLTDFMSQKEFLAPDGTVRSIILSEQGYTSNSNVYGKCEAEQAASIVYAYYKAEMNKDIDAFIYFLQKDDENASLGNDYYQFGLSYINSDGDLEEKLSYDVFKNMDKSNSLDKLSYIKDIFGITDYSEIISNFDKTIFSKFDESKDEVKDKRNISDVQVKEIDNQKYTGKECLPNVIVEIDGKTLINDVDYDVAYLNNIEPGKATAVIVGLDNFEGTKEINFLIEE